MEPEIKKIRLATPYVIHPETSQIYGFYEVVVKWPDGTIKKFNSEEHAKAYIENRNVDNDSLQKEFPDGVIGAIENQRVVPDPDKEGPPPEEEQEDYDVIISSYGESKVPVIKIIRTLTGRTLMECKELISNMPSIVVSQTSKENAESVKQDLEAVGAVIELK
jgi:large subunit ribosomal protein L7/L12